MFVSSFFNFVGLDFLKYQRQRRTCIFHYLPYFAILPTRFWLLKYKTHPSKNHNLLRVQYLNKPMPIGFTGTHRSLIPINSRQGQRVAGVNGLGLGLGLAVGLISDRWWYNMCVTAIIRSYKISKYYVPRRSYKISKQCLLFVGNNFDFRYLRNQFKKITCEMLFCWVGLGEEACWKLGYPYLLYSISII